MLHRVKFSRCTDLCVTAGIAMCGSRRRRARPSSRLPRACPGRRAGSRRSPGAGRAGEVGSHDVGGIAVQAPPAVVAAGLAWGGVASEVLNVTRAAARVEASRQASNVIVAARQPGSTQERTEFGSVEAEAEPSERRDAGDRLSTVTR
jgi:hypothetical protein